MREIEFRGKPIDNDNGEWAHGYLIELWTPKGQKQKYAIDTCQEYTWNEDSLGVYEIIPETVGQYTGLKDKNGKKIFEGDILDCTDRITFVHWNEFCGTWDCKFIRYKSTLCSNGITPVEWKYRAEIIGNIYENPELLKEASV